mgnify:CR=1 FL=1
MRYGAAIRAGRDRAPPACPCPRRCGRKRPAGNHGRIPGEALPRKRPGPCPHTGAGRAAGVPASPIRAAETGHIYICTYIDKGGTTSSIVVVSGPPVRQDIVQRRLVQNLEEGTHGLRQQMTQATYVCQQAVLAVFRLARDNGIHVRFHQPHDITNNDFMRQARQLQPARPATTRHHHPAMRQAVDDLDQMVVGNTVTVGNFVYGYTPFGITRQIDQNADGISCMKGCLLYTSPSPRDCS